MGVVKRQGSRNTLFSYIGFALGGITTFFLFPNLLKEEEVGLIKAMMAAGSVFAQIAALGLAGTVIKYFPSYRSETDKTHGGLIFFYLSISCIGFIIMTLLYLLFQDSIIDYYQKKSPLFVDYFGWVVLFGFSVLFYTLADILGRIVYKTVIPFFTKEIFIRLAVFAGLMMVYMNIFNFHEYFLYYSLSYFLIMPVATFAYIIYIKRFSFRPNWSVFKRDKAIELFRYSGFSFFSMNSAHLAQQIDVFMVMGMRGLEANGIYSTAFYLGVLVSLPFRAISRVAGSIVADAWNDGDMQKLKEIYSRTSLIQIILGCLLLIGLYFNLDNVYYFIPPSYKEGFWVVILIGAGYLVDMATGLNSYIILTSPKYFWDFWFNIIFLTLTIYLNYLLIPIYGIIGAAAASAMSFAIFNLMKWFFLYRTYQLQPFDIRALYTLLIALVTFGVAYILPSIHALSPVFPDWVWVILDSIYKSITMTGIYMGLIISLNVSPDLSEAVLGIWKKLVK